VSFNPKGKPFDDERVRQALSLAVDRYDMANVLKPLSGLDTVGSYYHPDSPFAISQEELQKFPGFGKDSEANVAEAKRLLTEAGYPDGFKTVLMNRAIKLPYIDLGVYIVSAWKKVGVEAEHQLQESATWSKNRRDGNFSVLIDPYGGPGTGDPDYILQKFITGGSSNYNNMSDPVVDALFEKQKVELDEQKRIELNQEIQRHVLSKMYFMPGLWWTRIEVRSARIKNYEPMHSHHMNRRMEDVWLAAEKQ
jgi:peptide/nickel transport system substrate-binding protein